jgi:O-antigen/teichoic acid export membrane protein
MYIKGHPLIHNAYTRRNFLHPSSARPEYKKEYAPTIKPKLSLPFKHKIPDSALSAMEFTSSQDTIPMFAVVPAEYRQQSQKPFHTDIGIEDIAYQVTLPLPILKGLSDQRQVIASTAGSAAIAGSGDLIFAVLRYITNVSMTNIVTASVYGIYSTAYASATIVGSIAALGLDCTILRFLSTYRAKGERGLAAGLLRFAIGMTLISGLLFGLLFFLSSTAIAHLIYHRDTYALPLKEITLLVPLIALQLILANGLLALRAIQYKVLVDRLIQPVLCLVLIGVFHLLGLQLEALILATICSFLASVITGQMLLRKTSKHLIRHAVPQFESKIWLRFSLPMSFYTFIQSVMNSTDVLFLTAFASAAQVGLYAAADRTSTFVIMPLFALNTIFSPMIAEYYARGEYEQLASLAKLVTKWTFSLSLPIFLCFCVFHEAILSIFSKGYTQAGIALIILSFGNLVIAGAGSTGILLMMAGHTRVILVNTATTIFVNIGVALVLVPRFDIVGAAVAAALTVVILSIAYFIEVYWLLNMTTLRRDMLKPLAAGGIASIIGLQLLRFVHVGYGYRAIIGTLGLVIPFICVYVLVLALLRFSAEDKVVFDVILAKVRRRKQV